LGKGGARKHGDLGEGSEESNIKKYFPKKIFLLSNQTLENIFRKKVFHSPTKQGKINDKTTHFP